MRPFVKVVRSGARDATGDLPPTVWREVETAPTLNTSDSGKARAVVLAVGDDNEVRILTPEEHEVLQGFPRGFTGGEPDSYRYFQLGNAVTVPVIEWIGARL